MPIINHKVTILRRTVNTALLSCAVIAAAAFVPTAASASITGVDEVTTKIDKRDLKSDYGIKRVYKTLSRKADISCGVNDGASLSQRNAARTCAAHLLGSFVNDLNHQGLTQYHRAMSKDS